MIENLFAMKRMCRLSTCGIILVLALISGCKSKLIGGVDEINRPVTVEFTERNVQFKGGGGVMLEGSMMVPAGSLSKTYPCVLLISGSGPTDRNGNQPNLKPNTMKQIAVGLAGAGIASFRFDKRAVGRYSMQWPKSKSEIASYFSWSNHVLDVEAAWNRMLHHGLVDPKHCGILGHSEGGLLGLFVANKLKPKALVLASSPGRSYREIIHWQIEKQGNKELLAASDSTMSYILQNGKLPDKMPANLGSLYNPSVTVFFQQIGRVLPTNLVSGVSAPMLILNGDSDKQVDAILDAKSLFAACSNRQNCRLEILPLASHNLKPVDDIAELGLVGAVVPDAIEAIDKFFVPILGGKVPANQLEVEVD